MNGRSYESYKKQEDKNPIPQFTDYLQVNLSRRVEVEEIKKMNGFLGRNPCEKDIYKITYVSNGLKRDIGKVVVKDNNVSSKDIFCKSKIPIDEDKAWLGSDLTFFRRTFHYREEVDGRDFELQEKRLDDYDIPFP